MGLRFIVGRAGSGKTRLCYREISRRLEEGGESPLILLVPEQATFQNELALASVSPAGGLLRAQVLSFRRLAWRVLNEVGGSSRVFIGDLGRRMLIRGIIDRRKKELSVFGRAADQPGFTDVMSSFLSELKTCRVMPGDLARAAGGIERERRSRLYAKLTDVDLIYSDMEGRLRDRFIDPDDYLSLLAGRVHLSPTVAGAEVWVDGFTGFTPQEYLVLEKIMAVAARVSVTVCADRAALERPPAEGEVFYATGETVHRLRDLAGKNGVRAEPPVVLEECRRFGGAPALSHLEKSFFAGGARQYTGACGEIKLVAADGPRAEVEAAAREIVGLCRDGGYRWREIAVLVRNIGMYHVLVNSVFGDYGIPFFIDHKGTVTHHPLVELIRSALEAVGGGWSYDAVFRYLKTDLAPVGREDVDILENYVLAHGIRGSAWLDERDWQYRRLSLDGEGDPAGDRAIIEGVNRARRKGLGELITFYNRVRPDRAPTVRSLSEALFGLLTELDVPARLVEWSDQSVGEGDLTRAMEHDRIWGQVVDLLDQVVAAFGDDPTTPEKFAGILESGLVSLRLGLIPPGLDQVTVGSLDRSRSPDIRAALVLGVNDGIFPARHPEDGLLNDAERDLLARMGITLDTGSRKNVFKELYLVYTALTRASDFLWISCCRADGEGRSMLPSRIVGRIRHLFPNLREVTAEVEPAGTGEEDLEFVVERGRTLGHLASRLREYLSGRQSHVLWWDVYNWFAGAPHSREGLEMVRRGLFSRNTDDGLSPEVAREFYGQSLLAGVSGIEQFNSCPFAYFLAYGLRLRERLNYRVTPPDMGQFLHAALRIFAERVGRDSLDWGGLDPEAVAGLAGEIVDSLAPRLQDEILLSSARYRHLVTRLRRRLIRSASVLAAQAGRGSFRPVALEVRFGPGGPLPPVSVSLPEGRTLEITGRIDRVDACRCEKGSYLIVIDYKSGFNDIDLAGVYHGVGIQLPAYLDVALAGSELLAGEEAHPGGILYFTVADPVISSPGPVTAVEAEKMIMRRLRMRGLVLADPDLVKRIDSQLERHSDVIPVKLTGAGEFYKNSPVVPEERFSLLRKHLRRVYRKAGSDIFSGQAGIQPVKIRDHTACRFCRFGAVCRFDPALPENRYRTAPAMDNDRIWQAMSQSGGGEDE